MSPVQMIGTRPLGKTASHLIPLERQCTGPSFSYWFAPFSSLFNRPADLRLSRLSQGELKPSGDGVVWNWRRPTGPSVFELKKKQETVFALATHLPPEESDLRTLDADVMTERLAGGRKVVFHRVAESDKEHDRSWIWFAVVAVVALVGEIFVLRTFRS